MCGDVLNFTDRRFIINLLTEMKESADVVFIGNRPSIDSGGVIG